MRDVDARIPDDDMKFPRHVVSALAQPELERLRVYLLEEAESEASVHREERTDH